MNQLHHHMRPLQREILHRCPTLQRGYRPPRWGRSPHAQISVFMVHEARSPEIVWDFHQTLCLPDGGTVTVEGYQVHAHPNTTPTLVVLPTICGNAVDHRGFVQRLSHALEWPVVVCNRRGHEGVPFTAPQFNTMGNTRDLGRQLDAIQRARPGSPLFAVGLSAGSGLIVRYLGEQGLDTPVQAAVVYCPGYDLQTLFDYTHTAYSRIMAGRVIDYFLRRNADVLRDVPGFEHACTARNLSDLHLTLHHLAGYTSRKTYLAGTNPMEVAFDIQRPVLVINAEDDPVCHIDIVHRYRPRLVDEVPGSILAVTRYGSHCGHYEDLRSPMSWAERAMVEYFRAAHELLIAGGKSVGACVDSAGAEAGRSSPVAFGVFVK